MDDVIEAFVDGESVDPAQLKAALAEAEGRDLLIDLLALRGLVSGQRDARPAAADPASPASRVSRLRLLGAAAAIAGVGIFGGYLAGSRGIRSNPVPSSSAATIAPATAPAPTHVIRLENGVDWNERSGGH